MTDTKKRTQQIIKSAETAIAKIANPTLRAKAIAKLEATRKKLTKGNTVPARNTRRRRNAQDLDIER